MRHDSADLFPETLPVKAQGDLFGAEPAGPVDYRPDPAAVRAKLTALLGEARSASVLPWTPAKTRLYRTIFPQMSLWLPEEEAAQLRFAFEEELERLAAA